ncbi:restriction endonuclease [Streptomyces sp. NPDC057681]|uniref:restriction endonuclease n=1 Tax=Streptomyces sp. NPDC057681 TaxID=3346209 RepID=UPI00367446CD
MGTPARHLTRPPEPSGTVSCLYAAAAAVLALAALGLWGNGHVVGAFFTLLALVGGGIALGKHRIRQAARRRQFDAERQRVRELQSTEMARYHAMKPREFEEAIAFLCKRDGCIGTQVVGGAGDLGADVIATAPDGRRIVIQCKRYGPTTKVGSPDLQRFGGTCYSVHGAQIAAVVTTSVFTSPAADYASSHGIRLFDEKDLAAWATRTGPAPWMLP